MATYFWIEVNCNLTSGSGYAYVGKYRANFSGTSYTRSGEVWEIGDVLTVVADPVPGYTCVTKTLTVTSVHQRLTVRYEKNSTPPAPTYYPAIIECNISDGSGDVWAYGGNTEYRQTWSGTYTKTAKSYYESGDTMHISANPVSGYETPSTTTYTFKPNEPYIVTYKKISIYTLSYSKSYSDAVGTVPSNQSSSTKVYLQNTDLYRPANDVVTPYSIKFNNANGSAGNKNVDGTITQPKKYAFSHWTIGGTRYNVGDEYWISSDSTAFAQYESTTSNNGTASISGVTCPDPGTRVGHDFTGWLASNGRVYQVGDKYPYSTGELTAQWAERSKYYIYFYKDNTEKYPSNIIVAPNAHTWVYSGGSFTLPGNVVSKDQTANGPYTVIFVPANGNSNITSSYYNRTKYTQNGWAYYNTTTWLSSSETINDIRSNLSFQAYWSSESWNDTIKTPSTEPTKTGYTFKGWLADDGVLYGTNANYTPSGTGQKQLTAQWEINKYEVSLSVSPAGSGLVSGAGEYEYGKTATIIATPNAGYSFKEWSDGVTSSNRSIFVNSDLSLTAYFELIEYKITWDLDGGTWVTQYPTTYNITSNIESFPTPEKAGYKFLGWYDNSVGAYVSSISPGTTGDKSFVAKWEAKEYTYNIVYKSNSGVQLGTSTVTGKYGSSTQVSPKSFTGYTSPGAQTVTFDSTTAKTITFIYTPIEYTITWILNGGSWGNITPRTKYTIESERYVFETPIRENYTFGGWYDNSSFTGLSVAALNKGVTGDRTYYAKWQATFTLRVIRDNVCNVSVTYGSSTSSSGGDTSYAELAIQADSSPTFTIKAFGGMGTAYDFDRWEYESSFSRVTFGDKNSKETTATISSAVSGSFIAYVYAYTKKVPYFKIKLGDHVTSCKVNYTPYWGGNTTVTQTAKEVTYYAVAGTTFSVNKFDIVAEYGYVATSGFGGYPGYTDDTLSNVKTITVSKTARYSLSAVTNANGTSKGGVKITSDDGGSVITTTGLNIITLAEQISSKFTVNALPNNSNYYFSHWTKTGANLSYLNGTKNTDRDIRVQFTDSNVETVYGAALQANFNAWPSVRIGCRVADSNNNPVLNGQYGVGDVKITYSTGASYASNGDYLTDSKYEIKGYDIKGRGWVSRPGEYLSLEAIPATGYEFSKWILFGSQEDTFITQSLEFQVPFVSCVLYAIFVPTKRDISISSNSSIVYNDPGRFYICKGTYDSSYTSYDTSIKILNNVDTFHMVAPIEPATGYELDGWYVGNTTTKVPYQTLATNGKNYAVATISPANTYYGFNSFTAKYTAKKFTLSTHTRAEILGTTATGIISPDYSEGTTVSYGQKISFTAKPSNSPRSKFSRWMLQRSFGDELELGTDTTLNYVHNYLSDVMLTAVFDLAKLISAHIYVDGSGTFDITQRTDDTTYTYNDQIDKTLNCYETDTIILTAKPSAGCKFKYWRYSGTDGRMRETTDKVLNLPLLNLEYNMTCIAFFEEIKYNFYLKQQGGDDKCTTAITIGSDVYYAKESKIEFTANSISGKIVKLVSEIKEGSEYVFRWWKITNSDGRTQTITDKVYEIKDLTAYGESFTITAVYMRASQGNLTVRVVAGSKTPFTPATGDGSFPKEYTTAQQWYDTGDNYKYYLSKSQLTNPEIFGECTWYVNGRTAQMRGGAAGSWAPKGTQSWPNASDWPSACEGNWYVSDTPQVGSVAVFRRYMSGAGHVGVVEKVNPDGTVDVSQFNGVTAEYYHKALPCETGSSPSNFIFLNNTVNRVINETILEDTSDSNVEDEKTQSGTSINIGGTSWIEYNSQQYSIVTTYFTGDTCTIVAQAESGFAFDYWQDPHGNIIYGEENSTYSFTVTEDTAGTYLAYFRRTETGPSGEEPEEPYNPEQPIEYKYYAYSVVQSYTQQRGQAYWNYAKKKWLVGYGPYLTSKFIELDYLESNSTDQQWINLGWRPSPLTIFEFTGQFTNLDGDQIFGHKKCGIHVQDGAMWFECGSKTNPIEFDTNVHTFKINCGTGECFLDNVLYSCTKLDRVEKNSIKLFGLDNEDFASGKIALEPHSTNFKLYSAKIWDINANSQNVLVRDLVPVRRWHRQDDSNLSVGMWDRVFNRYYQSNAYKTLNGEYTRVNLIAGSDKLENNEPKVLEKTYR